MNNIANYLQMMDVSGQSPTVQNISGQRNLYAQNMGAMKALGQQALSGQQTLPLQSLADTLRLGIKDKQPGLGQMVDAQGNIVYDPTYGNINQSSIMQNSTNNPYENPV
jgi:hypothetical protein